MKNNVKIIFLFTLCDYDANWLSKKTSNNVNDLNGVIM